MKVEASVHQLAIRVYEDNDPHPDNYVASCQVDVYGDRAWVYSINGAKFYHAFADILLMIESYGIRLIEGYVTRAHARLIRQALRRLPFGVELRDHGFVGEHELTWVAVQRKLDQNLSKSEE